ncbi:hypothetical protein J53TS2_26400 [Paenibacillus sp. J53TS2]|nr:hypothetical protein J53TS2_26400 [Paenibacillus sp. J53TS2]
MFVEESGELFADEEFDFEPHAARTDMRSIIIHRVEMSFKDLVIDISSLLCS